MPRETWSRTVTLSPPPIRFNLRFRENIFCPGCADPLVPLVAHVYSDTLWCPSCPPANPYHLLTLLGLIADDRLLPHWLLDSGVHGYRPKNAPRLPIDRLLDWLIAHGKAPARRDSRHKCPLLSLRFPPPTPATMCPNMSDYDHPTTPPEPHIGARY